MRVVTLMRLVTNFLASRRSARQRAFFVNSAARWFCEASAGPSASSRWYELPPVPPQAPAPWKGEAEFRELTALRWLSKSCPGVPHSLLHRLFRKRQVRMRTEQNFKPHRVSEKELLQEGAVLCVPASLAQTATVSNAKLQHQPGPEEVEWLQSLVLYKDAEVLVMNKPAGMAVQGGTNVGKSLDSVMQEALSFGYPEGPRLVHRLDKDTSGVLILGRTSRSTALLHALFRQKTADAEADAGAMGSMERRYLALVMGSPRQRTGRISAPIIRVVLDKGWSDRMVVADRPDGEGVQSAVTEYTVLGSSLLGCTWLELRPLTGRKHQLRVHCAQVLGMPIVGDFRYGWKGHREWPLRQPDAEPLHVPPGMRHKGDVLSESPWLHLHCRETRIPNVAAILDGGTGKAGIRCKEMRLRFLAPLPPHMQLSWGLDDRVLTETASLT